MAGQHTSGEGSLEDTGFALTYLETQLNALKREYEQFFIGQRKRAPEDRLREVKKLFRRMKETPGLNAAHRFRLRSLEQRFQAFSTYWNRVMREREAGTYRRDRFKADIRIQKEAAKIPLPSQAPATQRPSLEKTSKNQYQKLFETYASALEKSGGSSEKINYKSFEKSVRKQTEELQKTNPGAKIQFKVVLKKDGKVTLKARAKKEE